MAAILAKGPFRYCSAMLVVQDLSLRSSGLSVSWSVLTSATTILKVTPQDSISYGTEPAKKKRPHRHDTKGLEDQVAQLPGLNRWWSWNTLRGKMLIHNQGRCRVAQPRCHSCHTRHIRRCLTRPMRNAGYRSDFYAWLPKLVCMLRCVRPSICAGRIPPQLGMLAALQELDLSGNQLSGERLESRLPLY